MSGRFRGAIFRWPCYDVTVDVFRRAINYKRGFWGADDVHCAAAEYCRRDINGVWIHRQKTKWAS